MECTGEQITAFKAFCTEKRKMTPDRSRLQSVVQTMGLAKKSIIKRKLKAHL